MPDSNQFTDSEHLLSMARDIAANLSAGKTEQQAAEAVASHLKRFWAPAMRQQLLALCKGNDQSISPTIRRAAALL